MTTTTTLSRTAPVSYPVGTKLRLQPKTRTFGANTGALVRVTREAYLSDICGHWMIDVEGLDENWMNQSNGGYCTDDFEPLNKFAVGAEVSEVDDRETKLVVTEFDPDESLWPYTARYPDGNEGLFSEDELSAWTEPKKLAPQTAAVLDMLKSIGRITGVQAWNVLKVRSLPRRISDLKEAGHEIVRTMKVDHTGQRYAEYTLAA